MRKLLVLLFVLFTSVGSVMASDPAEVLDDPAQEERAREIFKQLRCVVCKNQSIDESDSMPAKDLRMVIRERIVAGDSDEEVMDFVVTSYGEFVLLQPTMTAKNIFLWFSPLLALLGGIVLAVWFLRSQRQAVVEEPASLSEEERQSLNQVLDKDD
jgi:cytochrome c-type biogenesis protein CcmH